MNGLAVQQLRVEVAGRTIVNDLSLQVPVGEVHAIMGPNGSGKSTLAQSLLGHPNYQVTAGQILWQGREITALPPHERSKLGLFLSFQYPQEISGVSMGNFLRLSVNARRDTPYEVAEFLEVLKAKLKFLGMSEDFIARSVNEGFSGGEKKRAEILQLLLLQPALAILDETDSGLDIDALKVVAQGVNSMRSPERGFLIITHYQRLLDYVQPDVIHVLVGGKIIKTGGPELAKELERTGYQEHTA